MKLKWIPLAGALSVLAAISGTATAGTINIDSGPGLSNSLTAGTVAITPHPAWQLNNPVNPGNPLDSSAVWISYALTGVSPDGVLQPFIPTLDPAVSIFHDFTSGNGVLILNVWADDTAEVLLDGVQLFSPKFSQSTCSGVPIGCLPEDVGMINQPLSAGHHELEFRVFQVGTGTTNDSNPFGLLYTGTATAVPEPGTLALTGGILMVVGLIRRRAVSR